MNKLWDQILLSSNQDDSPLWELFHVNSRCSEHVLPSNFLHKKDLLLEPRFLDYINFPAILLPKINHDLNMPLTDAIKNRISKYNMTPDAITLEEIAILFAYGYAVKRSSTGNQSITRYTPSAGALYPIEIYFHYSPSLTNDLSISPGLYYYNPLKYELRLLINKNCHAEIKNIFMQSDLVKKSAIQIFITSIFHRITQKYGDRGYKFAFLEAGHIAQNFNLVATAMELSCINIGGYYERKANELLKIDGISHSTIYTMLIGR